ncbi:MAG: GntR family transcriptional regulator [Anaerolineales bacterium]|nr:GntR family transcriptional regulator [Chloroflexota bacterium]MBL6981062.1 GntR family transcriptional regulator [Anaerolineales bacterium]
MKPTDAEKAYNQIKDQIVTTKMHPGSVISEAQLMEELNLGRTPIREAIKQLQAENLVTVTPRRGMYVADVKVTDLTQIFEVRVELESFAARLATERITEEQLRHLRSLANKYHLADPTDKEALISIDNEFHSQIIEAANNKFLLKELEHFYNLSLRIWYLAINYAQPEDINVDAHVAILEAIEAGDAQSAGHRMKTHIEKFHQTIKQYL